MKLRNKKTGEIVDFGSPTFIIDNTKNSTSMRIKNLAELNEEWEDYEEPKDYWVVDYITSGVDSLTEDYKDPDVDNFNKEIGNYFVTKEEAEQAVKKLKAWKRLKDKGFKFNGWEESPSEDDFDMIWFTMKAKVWDAETQDALDSLFGD